MPSLDLPVSELKKYQGMNPRPEDFDEYWDRALAELNQTEADPVFTKAAFQAKSADCYDLWYTGVGGAKIHAMHLRPKRCEGKMKAILLFHGYGGNSGDWAEKLSYVSEGFAVFAMDVRGQGGLSEDKGGRKGYNAFGQFVRGLSEDNPDKLFFRDIYLDTAQLARIVFSLDVIDPEHVYAYGRSQGGGLTLACAALEPRIKKAVSVYPFLCDFKRVWDLDLGGDAYKEIREYFRYYDPCHTREKELFTRLGYLDLQFLAPRIKADLMMITGLQDNICPPSTQFAAYHRMKCKKYHVIYPDFGHEDLWGSLDLIFNFLVNDSIDTAYCSYYE